MRDLTNTALASPPSPASPCCEQSPTRSAGARALHGITALLTPPSGIPAELLNGHAEYMRAREPASPSPSTNTIEPEAEQPQRKRTLEPVVEEDSEEAPSRAKRARVRARRRSLSPVAHACAADF